MSFLHLKIIVRDGMKYQRLWLRNALLALLNP